MEQTQITPLESIPLSTKSTKKAVSTLKRADRAARRLVDALCDLNPDTLSVVAQVFAEAKPRTARDFGESLTKALEAQGNRL